MSVLGNLSYFLCMEFQRTDKGTVIHQRKYVNEVMKRFIMLDPILTTSAIEANLKLKKNRDEEKVDATLFKQIVGSLRYVCTSKHGIGFLVVIVSR